MEFTAEEEYLQTNKETLNITGIAREAGIPEGTLRSVVLGNRPLPEKHRRGLEQVITKLTGGNVCE